MGADALAFSTFAAPVETSPALLQIDSDWSALCSRSRSMSSGKVADALINREFAKQCWIMPLYWTTWGIVMKPSVQNVSRDTMPDGNGFLLDGAGFPGQVWLDAVWKTQ